jgi:hypothetical protein
MNLAYGLAYFVPYNNIPTSFNQILELLKGKSNTVQQEHNIYLMMDLRKHVQEKSFIRS